MEPPECQASIFEGAAFPNLAITPCGHGLHTNPIVQQPLLISNFHGIGQRGLLDDSGAVSQRLRILFLVGGMYYHIQ